MPTPTLEIKGRDFRSVEKVIINEVPAPEFILVNSTTIWAQLPSVALNRISTVEVVSSQLTRTNESSKLSFEIGDKSRTTSGIIKLLQLFTKWLLQSPGSDIFNPGIGGGLQEIVGKVLSTRKMEPVLAAITRSVQTTTTQIRTAQMNQPTLSLDERLLSAQVVDLNIYEQQMEARVKIEIRSVAGKQAAAELGL
jgi:hypothetical protein